MKTVFVANKGDGPYEVVEEGDYSYGSGCWIKIRYGARDKKTGEKVLPWMQVTNFYHYRELTEN